MRLKSFTSEGAVLFRDLPEGAIFVFQCTPPPSGHRRAYVKSDIAAVPIGSKHAFMVDGDEWVVELTSAIFAKDA